jgi:hypothetical protein
MMRVVVVGALCLVMLGVAHGQGTTGKPVAMEFERKTIQTLTDGTHIANSQKERFIRDSMGRMRTEFDFPAMSGRAARTTISVSDPVAGENYSWSTGGTEPQHYMVNKIHPQQAGAMSAAPQQPTVQPQMTREKLGIQDVQGFSCIASRLTQVYPVGYEGNDRPITSVHESCFSQEFGRALKDHSEDPRSGVADLTLLSITRVEPEASEFQPPAGFTPTSVVSVDLGSPKR